MKVGRSLDAVCAELIRQAQSKRDFIAQAPAMRMNESGSLNLGMGPLELTEYAHWQLAAWLSIPKPYYERMLSTAPQLLSQNVNEWTSRSQDKRMVRTLDEKVRAVLSDRYRPLDNYDLAEHVLPALQNSGATIESCEITESRFYLKAVKHESAGLEVSPGDVVKSGLVISNSEVGAGSLRVEPMIYRLVCKNGAIAPESLKKYHSGKRSSDLGEWLRNETRKATDRAFWMQVKDMCSASMRDLFLHEWVRSAQLSREDAIEKPQAIVELVGKDFGLSEGEKSGVLDYLAKGGDMSRYGLGNAITRYAQDVDSYDRSTELERIGGSVFELPRSSWEFVSKRSLLAAS